MFETLGHYKILDRIGAGGLGEVYRARDTRVGRTVAIKVLPAPIVADELQRERLLRDAQAAIALSHPNIAALYEVGEDRGELFLVFEFVPGETLKAVIGGRPLNPRRAVEFAIQLADALADGHAEGVLHEHLTSASIIVTPKGHAKLLDFGLAAWTADGVQRSHAATPKGTADAAAVGSMAYMSPEQACGERGDQRADIFSLGIVLFEMITGRLPFSGATPEALALQIASAAAPAPSSIVKGVQPELDAIVLKVLAKPVDQRYESAATLAAELRALKAVLDDRSHANPPARPRTDARSPSAHSWTTWLVVVVLALAASVAATIKSDAIRREWRRLLGSAASPNVAVMPLVLADADPSQAYLADGLTDDLVARLGQTPGIQVLGRSSIRGSRSLLPRDVARELGAAVVLTGSVHPSGDSVQVAVGLANAVDGSAIWKGEYTGDLKDIFGLQTRIADEIAGALRVPLRPTAERARLSARVVDPRGYDAYLRARQASAERRIVEAIALYREAVTTDAGLAEAYAGLADALPTAQATDAKSAAERAYQIDPDLPLANVAMSRTTPALAESLKYLRHAIEVDPSDSDGYRQIAEQIVEFDPALAIRFWRKSLAVDPHLRASHDGLATAYALLHQWDETRKEGSPAVIAFSDLEERRFDTALAAMEPSPALRASEPAWSAYVIALASAGRSEAALKEATQGIARFPASCQMRAVIAGARLDRGRTSAAHQTADPLLRASEGDGASPAAVRCAVTIAAALKDGATMARLLDRIRAREDLLRYWASPVDGITGGLLLHSRQYPFSVASTAPIVAAAMTRLDEAEVRERDVARAVLAGLP